MVVELVHQAEDEREGANLAVQGPADGLRGVEQPVAELVVEVRLRVVGKEIQREGGLLPGVRAALAPALAVEPHAAELGADVAEEVRRRRGDRDAAGRRRVVVQPRVQSERVAEASEDRAVEFEGAELVDPGGEAPGRAEHGRQVDLRDVAVDHVARVVVEGGDRREVLAHEQVEDVASDRARQDVVEDQVAALDVDRRARIRAERDLAEVGEGVVESATGPEVGLGDEPVEREVGRGDRRAIGAGLGARAARGRSGAGDGSDGRAADEAERDGHRVGDGRRPHRVREDVLVGLVAELGGLLLGGVLVVSREPEAIAPEGLAEGVQHGPGGVAGRTARLVLAGEGRNRARLNAPRRCQHQGSQDNRQLAHGSLHCGV